MRRITLSIVFLYLAISAAFAQAQEGGSVIIAYDGQSYEFTLQAAQSDWGG